VHAANAKEVYAITDGEIVGCRVGEGEQAKDLGSRNFVLIRHKRGADAYYSLYMHLDGEAAGAGASVRWRRELYLRSKDHVEALVPSPIYKHVPGGGPTPSRLVAQGHGTGLAKGEHVEVVGNALSARQNFDATLPRNSEVYKLAAQAQGGEDQYIFTKRAS